MRLLKICVFVCVLATAVLAQQLPDPEFNTSVENPAYSRSRPRVMFDEAHHNFHTTDGRYKPFADLMMNDGYQVIRSRKPFTKQSLDSFKILVIANALGAEEMDDEGADQSAFTEDEIKAVYDWGQGWRRVALDRRSCAVRKCGSRARNEARGRHEQGLHFRCRQLAAAKRFIADLLAREQTAWSTSESSKDVTRRNASTRC
jgi:hypothetical protein